MQSIYQAFPNGIYLDRKFRGPQTFAKFVDEQMQPSSEAMRDDLRGLCASYTKAADVTSRATIEKKMVALLMQLTGEAEPEEAEGEEVAASFGVQVQPFSEWVTQAGLAR
jgi:hypothetical protein